MFNSIGLCYRSFKPLSIFIKLADKDDEKVDKIKKIIENNFNLSPRVLEKC